MKFEDHVARCLEEVKMVYPKLYAERPERILSIVRLVTMNIDHYAATIGWNHRAKTHHVEGIYDLVLELSGQCGQEYSDLIRTIAEKHVLDDWQGTRKTIPKKEDYNTFTGNVKRED